MSKKTRTVLTAMIVVVLTAIYVVGLFLLWDVLGVQKILDDIFEKNIYGIENKPASSTKVNTSFDGKSVTAAEEEFLSEYFRFIYAGMGAVSPEKISGFYEKQCNSALFDDLAYRYEIFMLSECPLDLSFDSCELTLYIKRRHAVPKSTKVEIDLTVSASAEYKAFGKKTATREEAHFFVIEEGEKNPLIKEHSFERPCYNAAMSALDRVLLANGYYRSDLNYSFFPKYIDQTFELLKESEKALVFEMPGTGGSEPPEYEYDRDTAANTAINGFGRSAAFTEYEENDANFVSRCIFEGGIPMDSQGDRWDQWKWYDDEVSFERKKSGCSVTWYDREAFYKYIQVNKGFGMIAEETAKGGGEIGDVVQLTDSDGKAIQEFMITGVMSEHDGTVRDYLISNDRYSTVSLLSTGYTDFRVIHITGYSTG